MLRRTSLQPLWILSILIVSSSTLPTLDEYFQYREEFIKSSQSKSIGSNLILSNDEQAVNEILMSYKNQEFDNGFSNISTYLGSKMFYNVIENITQSEVYKIIKRMPKGGALHLHDTAFASQEYVFNITYEDDLYVQLTDTGDINALYFYDASKVPTDDNWVLVSEVRESDPTFDDRLRASLTLAVDDPAITYAEEGSEWSAFYTKYYLVTGMITYVPVFKKYVYQGLKELLDDNVKYLEIRYDRCTLYDIENNTYGAFDIVGIWQNVTQQFISDYPEFYGTKVIVGGQKINNLTVGREYISSYIELQEEYGDFIAGFDLSGQEDNGHPFTYWMPLLLEIANRTKFFLHAGETNWFGTTSDFDVIDAILLNSSRIGHGYSLSKHPDALKYVKQHDLAIEVSPISNQVFGMVKDLRNHPAIYLIANNYPVVIGNDDPGLWDVSGMSFDYYETFMALASQQSDLKLLKQLLMNSIKYSALGKKDKHKFFAIWEKDWNMFICDTLKTYKNATCSLNV